MSVVVFAYLLGMREQGDKYCSNRMLFSMREIGLNGNGVMNDISCNLQGHKMSVDEYLIMFIHVNMVGGLD